MVQKNGNDRNVDGEGSSVVSNGCKEKAPRRTPRLLNRLKQVIKIDGLIVVVDVSVLLGWIVVFIAINETNPT